MLGFLLQWPTLLTLLMFPVLVVMYVRLARHEEQDALAEFGDAYRRYAEARRAGCPGSASRAGECAVTAARPEPAHGAWLAALGWYLPLVFAANLAWETGQLPLYTLWGEGSAGEIAFAVGHCTGGDVIIAFGALSWPW